MNNLFDDIRSDHLANASDQNSKRDLVQNQFLLASIFDDKLDTIEEDRAKVEQQMLSIPSRQRMLDFIRSNNKHYYVHKVPPSKRVLAKRPILKVVRQWDNFRPIGMFDLKGPRMKLIVSLGAKDGVKYLHLEPRYRRTNQANYYYPEVVWLRGNYITIPLVWPVNDGQDRVNPLDDWLEIMGRVKEELENFPIEDPYGYVLHWQDADKYTYYAYPHSEYSLDFPMEEKDLEELK